MESFFAQSKSIRPWEKISVEVGTWFFIFHSEGYRIAGTTGTAPTAMSWTTNSCQVSWLMFHLLIIIKSITERECSAISYLIKKTALTLLFPVWKVQTYFFIVGKIFVNFPRLSIYFIFVLARQLQAEFSRRRKPWLRFFAQPFYLFESEKQADLLMHEENICDWTSCFSLVKF